MSKRNAAPKEMSIYAIVSPNNICYIGKTFSGNEYNAYKGHVHYRKQETAEFFRLAEQTHCYPKMYILSTVMATQELTYRHCLAWIRYFLEHKFEVIAYQKNLDRAQDLLSEVMEIYNGIVDLQLAEVLNDKTLRVRSYTKKDSTAPQSPKNRIKIYVTPQEYEEICEKSLECGLSISQYCKDNALKGECIHLTPSDIGINSYEHIATVRHANITLRQVLWAFYQNGKYFPADLENIDKAVTQIINSQHAVAEELRRATKILHTYLLKEK